MTEPGKRPPPRGGKRFQPGQSGNPRGCPTGSRAKVLVALDAVGSSKAQGIIDAMAQKALEGDTQAASLILSRIWPPRRGRPTPLDLPSVRSAADLTSATAALITATASGELSPEEAASVSVVLQTHRAALETAELEARVAALEAAKEPGR